MFDHILENDYINLLKIERYQIHITHNKSKVKFFGKFILLIH